MTELKDRTVLITGAASGIGAALAKLLVTRGAKVFLADVNADALAAVARELPAASVAYRAVDVSSAEDNAAMVAAAVEKFGAVHGAALNVGIAGKLLPIATQDVADFDRVMAVNVRGTWLGLKYLMPELARHPPGSIVLTASTAGTRAGAPNRSAYVASKHAVLGLMRAAAAEGAPLGIRVNSVSPGGVSTPMTHSLKDMVGPDQYAAMLKAFENSIPLKRLAQPSEIAETIAFLLSERAAYCTAANLMVDGGLTG